MAALEFPQMITYSEGSVQLQYWYDPIQESENSS